MDGLTLHEVAPYLERKRMVTYQGPSYKVFSLSLVLDLTVGLLQF